LSSTTIAPSSTARDASSATCERNVADGEGLHAASSVVTTVSARLAFADFGRTCGAAVACARTMR
jgi:hypothetical protein